MTIYQATLDNPVIALPGKHRFHHIGCIAYRFSRPKPLPNGMAQTLPRFVYGYPVMWVDGKWKDTQLGNKILCNWGMEITVIDTLVSVTEAK